MAKSLREIIRERREEGEGETRIAAYRDNFAGVLSDDNLEGITFTRRNGDMMIVESFSEFCVQIISEVPLGMKVTGCIRANHYPRGSGAYSKGQERLNYVGL